MKVDLTISEASIILAALDSHLYWQLSDPKYRNSGEVFDPRRPGEDVISDNPDQQREGIRVRRLIDKLNDERRKGG